MIAETNWFPLIEHSLQTCFVGPHCIWSFQLIASSFEWDMLCINPYFYSWEVGWGISLSVWGWFHDNNWSKLSNNCHLFPTEAVHQFSSLHVLLLFPLMIFSQPSTRIWVQDIWFSKSKFILILSLQIHGRYKMGVSNRYRIEGNWRPRS